MVKLDEFVTINQAADFWPAVVFPGVVVNRAERILVILTAGHCRGGLAERCGCRWWRT